MSPPPAIETSFFSLLNIETKLASSFVAPSKGFTSNAPGGPFQITVFEFCRISFIFSTVYGPISRIIEAFGHSFIGTTQMSALVLSSLATTASVGSKILHPAFSAEFNIIRALSFILCSARDVPIKNPCAKRKVFAMPPPTIRVSTL